MMSFENTPCSGEAASVQREIPHRIPVAVLLGPTAVGKSGLALRLAHELDYEIISCDSRQIYRGIDIRTAKLTEQLREGVVHWLIDIVNPDEEYSAFRFAQEAQSVIHKRTAAGKKILICGGTGLYFKTLAEGGNTVVSSDPEVREDLSRQAQEKGCTVLYTELEKVDPAYAGRIHPNDHQRIIRALAVFRQTGVPFSEAFTRKQPPSDMRFDVFILKMPRDLLYERINARVDAMIRTGLYDEFCNLRTKGYHEGSPGMRTVGYRELFAVEKGDCSLNDAAGIIRQSSRRYAKRQITWFSTQSSGSVIEYDCDFNRVCERFRQVF